MPYCSRCRSIMEVKLIPAETWNNGNEAGCYYPYDPYDMETGKRQYLKKCYCPAETWWDRFLSRPHTSFVVDKIVLKKEQENKIYWSLSDLLYWEATHGEPKSSVD